MSDLIPVEMYMDKMPQLSAICIAVVAAAFLRLLRIQVGGVLMLAAVIFLLLVRPGWEKGVFIFDLSIMTKNTALLFVFFIACEWLLVSAGPQLKSLTGSLMDTFAQHKVTAVLLPSLSVLAGTPREGTAIVDECMESKSPADRFAFVVWFRHLFTAVLPCLLLPIVLGTSLYLGPTETLTPSAVIHELWPLVILWLLAGCILLNGFKSIRVDSHPSYKPLVKVIFFPVMMVLPCFIFIDNEFIDKGFIYSDTVLIIASIWGLLIFKLITDKVGRKNLWQNRKELQIVRWFLLAAGISVWTWMFTHLLFFDHSAPDKLTSIDVSKYSLLVQLGYQLHEYTWLIVLGLPFLVGLICGHVLLTSVLVLPIALCSDLGLAAVLPTVGAAFLGTVLSYEHLSFLKLRNQYHGTTKKIYMKLLLPSLIAAALLALAAIR
jgi:hypothetical protein